MRVAAYIASVGGGVQLRTYADKRIGSLGAPRPCFDRGANPSNLSALSSEKTGFQFERKHWCRWQTRRCERA
jgi:hypothetical protein